MALFYKVDNYVFHELLELEINDEIKKYQLKLSQKDYEKFLNLVGVISEKANQNIIDFETMRAIIKMLLPNETLQKELLKFVEGEYLIMLIKDLVTNFKSKINDFENKKK